MRVEREREVCESRERKIYVRVERERKEIRMRRERDEMCERDKS